MLSLTIKVGQSITIGDGTTVKLMQRSGQSARLMIDSTHSPIKVLEDGAMPPRLEPPEASPARDEKPAFMIPQKNSWGLMGASQPH